MTLILKNGSKSRSSGKSFKSWSRQSGSIKVRATPEKTAKMTLKPQKPVNNGYFHFRHFFTSELLSEISKMSDEFGIVVAFDKSCVALLTIYFCHGR